MSKYTTAIIAGFIAAAVMTFLMMFVFEGSRRTSMESSPGPSLPTSSPIWPATERSRTADAAQKEAALALKRPPGQGAAGGLPRGLRRQTGRLNIAVDGKEFAQLTAPKFTTLVLAPGRARADLRIRRLRRPANQAGDLQVRSGGRRRRGGRHRVRLGAVQGSIGFTPLASADAARAKVARMPMVLASPVEILSAAL